MRSFKDPNAVGLTFLTNKLGYYSIPWESRGGGEYVSKDFPTQDQANKLAMAIIFALNLPENQTMITTLPSRTRGKGIRVILEDISTFTKTMDEHVRKLKEAIEKMEHSFFMYLRHNYKQSRKNFSIDIHKLRKEYVNHSHVIVDTEVSNDEYNKLKSDINLHMTKLTHASNLIHNKSGVNINVALAQLTHLTDEEYDLVRKLVKESTYLSEEESTKFRTEVLLCNFQVETYRFVEIELNFLTGYCQLKTRRTAHRGELVDWIKIWDLTPDQVRKLIVLLKQHSDRQANSTSTQSETDLTQLMQNLTISNSTSSQNETES